MYCHEADARRGSEIVRATAYGLTLLITFMCCGHPALADSTQTIHTSTMTLKTSALLALVGTLLLTVVVAVDFFRTVSGIMDEVVPPAALWRALVYLLASLSVTVFFYVFYKKQS